MRGGQTRTTREPGRWIVSAVLYGDRSGTKVATSPPTRIGTVGISARSCGKKENSRFWLLSSNERMIVKELSNKVAVITGAARGIGSAIAKRFAAEGALVVINYTSRQEEAERTMAAIQAKGRRTPITTM